MARDAIPVTILSGSLGAGKTTTLNHLLRNGGGRDIAVLVNDMGELNVDADLVSENSELAVDGGVAELSNGCICCELQDDLETAVVRLARNRDFDHLIVEPSGISEPEPIARLFTTGSSAAALYEVDSVATVVDTRLFYDSFGGDGVAEVRGTDEDGSRPLTDLLVEQIEFANLVVLNKRDLVSDAEFETVSELARALRPDAEVVSASFGEVDPDQLFDRGLYDPATAAERAGWQVALAEEDGDGEAGDQHAHDDHHTHGDDEHAHDGHSHDDHHRPEAVYDITSFTYRRRRPFHPERLADFFADLPEDVVRSKGTCWVAGCEQRLTYGHAGPSVRVTAAGPWIATLPELDQDLYRSNRKNLDWDEEWGDRKTELVFIGRGMDADAVTDALNECLLTDDEMDEDWGGFESRFPDEPEAEFVLAEPTPVA